MEFSVITGLAFCVYGRGVPRASGGEGGKGMVRMDGWMRPVRYKRITWSATTTKHKKRSCIKAIYLLDILEQALNLTPKFAFFHLSSVDV